MLLSLQLDRLYFSCSPEPKMLLKEVKLTEVD
jgi:hypothetical protein